MEDITQYARLDVTHRGVDPGAALSVLLARWLLGLATLLPALWRIFHVGPFAQARQEFVAPLSGTMVPVWLRWLVGFPLPFVDLIAGGLVLLGVQTRGALTAVACTILVMTLGMIVREPSHDFPLQLGPRVALLLYVLAMPESVDRWGLEAWLERKGMMPR
ncbi:MAG: hypothetical protein U0163_14045 [Gemmatimonadaceae bacterium]